MSRLTRKCQVLVDKATSPSGFDQYVGYLADKAGRDPDQVVADMRGEPDGRHAHANGWFLSNYNS